MKKTIIIIILAFVCIIGQAREKTIVWEKPAIAFNRADYLVIQKVELTKQQTRVFFGRYEYAPGIWYCVSKDFYLQSGGKQYPIISADSIKLGEKFNLDYNGIKEFVLNFEPLPMKTKEFDFIAGMGDNDFKLFGIHDSTYTMPAAPVPAEYLADYPEDDQFPEMKYSSEPAIVHFKALNYRKGMKPYIKVQYVDLKNPAEPTDVGFKMNDDGEAEISLPVGVPQVAWLHMSNFPWGSNGLLYLSPGKEITVLADMLKDDTFKNNKFVGYKGYFAKFAKEYYLFDTQREQVSLKETARTVEELIHDYDDFCEGMAKQVESTSYSKTLKELIKQIYYEPFDMFSDSLDSLVQTKEFTDHILKHHMGALYSPLRELNLFFLEASRYYVMDKKARGFNADLARYCYFLPKVLDGQKVEKPLIEDKSLSALYDQAVEEYRKTIAANQKELADNVHYLDMTDVAPENILQTILDKYKGKAVLIDLWATWCGPCRKGHKDMAPLKEQLKGKNIQFVYITSTSSPYEDWKPMLGDIFGNHYYLTKGQWDHLLELYQSNGIPTYAIYDVDGKLTYSTIGFPGLDKIKEEIEKVLK